MKLKKRFILGAVFLIIIGIIYIAYALSQKKDVVYPPRQGEELKSFSLTSFNRSKDFTQEDLKGHPSLLTFFASWCFSCRLEHKTLGDISRRYNIPLYGIAVRDNKEVLGNWLSTFGNPYKQIGLDVLGHVSSEFEIIGVPATFLIDEEGVIQYHAQGAIYADEEIESLEKALLKMGLTPR